MPGLIQTSEFNQLNVKPLHPTFGAEIDGLDFRNLSDEGFQEILAAMAKVNDYPGANNHCIAANTLNSTASASSETPA